MKMTLLSLFVCIRPHWSYSVDPGWEIMGERKFCSGRRPVTSAYELDCDGTW